MNPNHACKSLEESRRSSEEDEWDAMPRPLPPPNPKTRLQMYADDFCAGYDCGGRAVQLALKELDASVPDMASIKRIMDKAGRTLF